MTEESVSRAVEASSAQPVAPAGHDEGGSRGILREAIRKVMEEIEHHEREARHHLQQAAELRKALRESISFLQEQGEKRVSTAAPKASPAEKAGGPSEEGKAKQGASSNKHQRPKKK